MMKQIFALAMAAGLLIGAGSFASEAQAATPPAGSAVRIDNTIYQITSDGLRRPFLSENVYLSYGTSLDKVGEGSAEDAALPLGAPMPPRDGTVVCSNSTFDYGTCFAMTNGKKAPFASLEIMKSLGYSLDQAIWADVSLVPTAEPFTKLNEGHRNGSVVSLDGTIYYIGFNGKMGFPDLATFESWGFNLSNVVPAMGTDLDLQHRLVVEPRVGNEARPFEPVLPAPLELTNEEKFVVPFAGKTLPITEGWLYSPEERSVHGYVQHGGIDFAYNRGTPIYAAADGYAISSTHLVPLARKHQDKQIGFGLGEFIQVWHPTQGVYTSYSHLQRVADKIPYFKPKCKDAACDPEIVYSSVQEIMDKGVMVKQGELIGWMGDSGLSWGYEEKPRVERDHKEDESWDEVHLHFEMYTRDDVNFYKAKRYDPFGIYGRLNQYDEHAYHGPNSLWKLDENNRPVLAK